MAQATKLVNFKVSLEEFESLKQLAEKNERSVSGQIRFMLKQVFKEYIDEDRN